MNRPTVESWTDPLGQKYGPGDCIAYATISGRSPQMVIAEVLNIFTHDSKGEPYTESRWDAVSRTLVHKPSVSIQVSPLLDGRDFHRSSKPRAVNLTILGNIIKVPNELKPKPKAERDLERTRSGVLQVLKELTDDSVR